MSATAIIQQLAIRSQGRAPSWTAQAAITAGDTSAAPSTTSDGVALQDAVVALLGLELDAGVTSVDVAIWLLPAGRDTWLRPQDGAVAGIDASWALRVNVAGFRRVYLQVTSSGGSGDITPIVGPCLDEA